jgi:hypothetical protein
MSFGASAALQAAIFQILSADAAVAAAVGGAIHDGVPSGPVPPLFLSLGAEEATARGDGGGSVTRHRLTVSVISEAAGFREAKLAAAAVCDALDGALPALERGRLLSLRFERAQAARTSGNRRRRIDLRFAALVDGA